MGPVLDSSFKFFYKPVPILYQVSKRLNEIAQILETQRDMVIFEGKSTRDPIQNPLIHIICQNPKFSQKIKILK